MLNSSARARHLLAARDCLVLQMYCRRTFASSNHRSHHFQVYLAPYYSFSPQPVQSFHFHTPFLKSRMSSRLIRLHCGSLLQQVLQARLRPLNSIPPTPLAPPAPTSSSSFSSTSFSSSTSAVLKRRILCGDSAVAQTGLRFFTTSGRK